jgi:hypothetical protein
MQEGETWISVGIFAETKLSAGAWVFQADEEEVYRAVGGYLSELRSR